MEQDPDKKINKKIILLIIVSLVIIGFGAVYFLFLNKEDNNKLSSEEGTEIIKDEGAIEAEVDRTIDTDQDGLPDYIEEILGTDENNADTDGDSYSDFDEIKSGYNPLTDEKYMEEEWEIVKEIIRGEDKGLFGEIFLGNWKNYENDKYGFSFEYPSNWIINDNFDGGVVLSNYDNGSSSGLRPDYVELKIAYGAKLSSQSHDEFVKKFIESIKGFMPYFKDHNDVSELTIGNKKYLHTEGYVSLYSYEVFSNRIICAIVINNDLEKNNIRDIFSTMRVNKKELINSASLVMPENNDEIYNNLICLSIISENNNEVLCNVKVDSTFELLTKSYQNFEK